MDEELDQSQILFLGSYPPRECGIATFTKDLSSAIENRFKPSIRIKIAAMNKNSINIYNYAKRVIIHIDDSDINSYIEAAKKINTMPSIKAVSIQHEFGLFGGEYGSYLIAFLEVLEKPVYITFHSILPNPDKSLKKVVQSLATKSSAFIVMAKKGRTILREDYKIRNEIYVIHHGVPTIPFELPIKEKRRLGFKDRIILSSFGLMSEGKGYESVIESLVPIVKKYPEVLYLIVGETHPVVRKEEGEKYRNFLEKKVKDLGLQNNIKFYNKYLTLKEIIRYLKASDIYVCSSLNPNQITSGTLVYALAAGRPVISTPFLHAREAITNNRGRLVEFNDHKSFTKAILELVSDKKIREEYGRNAYEYTRQMIWPNVAMAYEQILNRYTDLPIRKKPTLPKVNFGHIMQLTNEFGMIQFANNVTPDIASGYTTDDNARAMLACAMDFETSQDRSRLDLIKTYLQFLSFVQQPDGRFMNYVTIEKKINQKEWIQDPHGRALWCLGYLLSVPEMAPDIIRTAKPLFENGLKYLNKLTSPRSKTFALLGLHFANQQKSSPIYIDHINSLATDLKKLYKKNSTTKWQWFEPMLAYSNSRLSEAMFYAYLATKNKEYLTIAKKTFDFLISTTFENGMFIPIGQRGWYENNGKRAYYDQQPVDTASMVQTLLLAAKITDEQHYKTKAYTAFEWFLGKNSLRQVVYNETTGGCYDGLGKSAVNINQGAESTVSYLLARLSFTQDNS